MFESRPRDTHYDVIVVGAGPAGATAARLLSQAGVGVLLLDKHRLPRYKTCGGGVVRRAARLAGIDFENLIRSSQPDGHRVVEGCAREVALHFGDVGRQFTVRRSAPLMFMTMRAQFDRHLVGLAAAAGAEVVAPCAFEDMSACGDRIELQTSAGTLTTHHVIAADGVLSRVARAGGWDALTHCIPALEWEVQTDEATLGALQPRVRFDFGVVPNGYAWVFPKHQHLSVGALQLRTDALHLKDHLRAYMRRVGIARVQRVERHGALIPVRPRRGSLTRGRALLVGDAAGLTDPVTCEGISFAIWSGRLAAEALLERPRDARAGADYDRRVRREIFPELRWARLLAAILYGAPRVRNLLFRAHGQALCNAMADVIAGQRTYRQLLGAPANYWRLLTKRAAPSPAHEV